MPLTLKFVFFKSLFNKKTGMECAQFRNNEVLAKGTTDDTHDKAFRYSGQT